MARCGQRQRGSEKVPLLSSSLYGCTERVKPYKKRVIAETRVMISFAVIHPSLRTVNVVPVWG